MRTQVLATAAMLALASAPALAQQQPTGTFEEETQRYEDSLARKAFYLRALAAERYARTGDARALGALLRRYARPEAPQDHTRYLLAGVVGDAFVLDEHVDALMQAAKKAATAPDSWLWFRALRLQGQHRGAEGVAEVALDAGRDPFIRAAALEALAQDPTAAEVALATVGRLLGGEGTRAKRGEKPVVLEACAWVLPGAREHVDAPAFQAAAGRVIDALDGKLGTRTKLVIARALAAALEVPALYLDAASWRRALADRKAAAQADAKPGQTRVRGAGAGVTTPRFFGIEGAGLRLVFVVDLSDSMLQPLLREEVEEVRRPRTGSDAGTRTRGGEGADDGDPQPAAEEDLPWARIKTRFDVARESLRRSLAALGPGLSFAVVVFGTKAELLPATPGLIRATPQNVQRAIAALDAIRPGAKQAGREHGTLRGHTNLHGALRLAFRALEGAPALPGNEHVAEKAFDAGADTVFVLSDGAPSWDDFDAVDVATMRAGDPETGAPLKDTGELHYYGPYVEHRFLLADVERMNLLRRAEVHCVGIGEASPELLRRVAALGKGELRIISGAAR